MARNALIQLRRGTASAIRALTSGTSAGFAAGEPAYASDSGELFVQPADLTVPPQAVSRSFNGVGNPPVGSVVMPFMASGTTNLAPVTGTVVYTPLDIWPAPITINGLIYQVTGSIAGASGTAAMYVGLYRDNGTGSGPLQTTAGLIVSSTNQISALSSNGIKTYSATATLQPGRYWTASLYYQGSAAPTTAATLFTVSGSTCLWAPTTNLAITRCVIRTGLTALPTDNVAVSSSSGSPPLVGLVRSA